MQCSTCKTLRYRHIRGCKLERCVVATCHVLRVICLYMSHMSVYVSLHVTCCVSNVEQIVHVLCRMYCTNLHPSPQLWITMGWLSIFPLCLLRNVDSLKYTSFAAVIFVMFLGILIVLYSFNMTDNSQVCVCVCMFMCDAFLQAIRCILMSPFLFPPSSYDCKIMLSGIWR